MTDDMRRTITDEMVEIALTEFYSEFKFSHAKGFNPLSKKAMRQAITAALRAAPEGFAVSPEDPSPSMIRAGLLFGLSPNQACAVYQSMLAARPQGVK